MAVSMMTQPGIRDITGPDDVFRQYSFQQIGENGDSVPIKLSYMAGVDQTRVDEAARERGFVPYTESVSQGAPPTNATGSDFSSQYKAIENKFSSETWKNSPMRDPMRRLEMFSKRVGLARDVNGNVRTNKDGNEIKIRGRPGVSYREMDRMLNARRKRFEETGNPGYLWDSVCSESTGCSEEELRETIERLRSYRKTQPAAPTQQVTGTAPAPGATAQSGAVEPEQDLDGEWQKTGEAADNDDSELDDMYPEDANDDDEEDEGEDDE